MLFIIMLDAPFLPVSIADEISVSWRTLHNAIVDDLGS